MPTPSRDVPTLSLSFFFQAEDGIRARDVTGVQTCALPILDAGGNGGAHSRGACSISCRKFLPPLRASRRRLGSAGRFGFVFSRPNHGFANRLPIRSEERRVGKEWRATRGGTVEKNKYVTAR